MNTSTFKIDRISTEVRNAIVGDRSGDQENC